MCFIFLQLILKKGSTLCYKSYLCSQNCWNHDWLVIQQYGKDLKVYLEQRGNEKDNMLNSICFGSRQDLPALDCFAGSGVVFLVGEWDKKLRFKSYKFCLKKKKRISAVFVVCLTDENTCKPEFWRHLRHFFCFKVQRGLEAKKQHYKSDKFDSLFAKLILLLPELMVDKKSQSVSFTSGDLILRSDFGSALKT